MKPQVPDILLPFYDRHDPAAHLHEIKTEDLPEVGTHYRDNTSGLVWQVIALSGEDMYEAECPDVYGYCDRQSSLVTPKRKRLVIMKSTEGVTMHVTPESMESQVSTSEHYCLVSKTKATMRRFEEVDGTENQTPFWTRSIKKMSTEKVLRKLGEEDTTSLYVLNVYSTPHGLAELLIEYLDTNSVNRMSQVAKIKATWLPQDILESAPKEAMLKSQTFRRMLDSGMIVAITKGSVKRIENTPEYEVEIERLNEREAKLKPYSAHYGMF